VRLSLCVRDLTSLPAVEVADVRDMPQFANASFDVIIDKGTLDAILCGTDSMKHSTSMLAEMHRVLKPGGTFFIISYGEPKTRLIYLDKPRYNWMVSHQMIEGKRYVYTMRKRAESQ